ncbi:protein containing 3-phosphoshikimate 1-carboxyvinyltransferase, core domain protein, partial [human gut metagenome]
MNATIKRAPGGIGGTITAPPSKSMAHRAVLCSALAEGASHIENLEFSKDISATLS